MLLFEILEALPAGGLQRALFSASRAEAILCEGQREITAYGGWRAYVASRATAARC